jgi:hypothetical protein
METVACEATATGFLLLSPLNCIEMEILYNSGSHVATFPFKISYFGCNFTLQVESTSLWFCKPKAGCQLGESQFHLAYGNNKNETD